MLVLESRDHATRRRAEVLAEVLGYGSSFDATAAPGARRSGAVAARSMMLALAQAHLNAADIDAVFAANLGTSGQDLAEARAIHRIFGSAVPVVTLKQRLGNTGAASGAIETACAIEALRRNVLPASDLEGPLDPASRLQLVLDQPRETRLRRVIIHSMALGGLNCSLVLGRASENS